MHCIGILLMQFANPQRTLGSARMPHARFQPVEFGMPVPQARGRPAGFEALLDGSQILVPAVDARSACARAPSEKVEPNDPAFPAKAQGCPGKVVRLQKLTSETRFRRHGRPCAGHPRLLREAKEDVDARDKPAHDGLRDRRLCAGIP